jgi:hypothetical protein
VKRVECIEGCDLDLIPDLKDGVLDGRWLVDVEALANSLFDADLEDRVYRPKAGDHLFYIGSAKRKDEDISFFALVRNVKPITKHILFKKYKLAGRYVLRLSNASEVGESLGGLYAQLEEEAYRGI